MNILLIDDDYLVTNGIQTILEMATADKAIPMKICAIGHNGQEAISLFKEHQPDILLMDIRMPKMDGIQAGQEILKLDPQTKIIYLTTFQEDEYIIQALKIGAKGYLLKTDYQSLIPAIEAVYQGQSVFGDQIVAKIPQFMENNQTAHKHRIEGLTERENELIYYLAQGHNNKEIAELMHFSEGTIRNYLSNLLDKLDLRDRTQLVIYYYKHRS